MNHTHYLNPVRRLAMALVVGGLERLCTWRKHSPGNNGFWRLAALAHDRFDTIGLAMVGFFVLAWAVSFGIGQLRCASRSSQF